MRARGYPINDAQDPTQGFFAYLIEHNLHADRSAEVKVALHEIYLGRQGHFRRRSLEYRVWIGLNHPEAVAVWPDIDVEGRPVSEADGALTVCLHAVCSASARRDLDDLAVCAHGGEWNRERAVAAESDAFNDRFRLRRSVYDVEAGPVENKSALQRLLAASRSCILCPRAAEYTELNGDRD